MTWGIFKHDSVADAVAKIQTEALKGDQHKLDKNKNGKLDKEDFKKLRKEETEVLDEASVASVAKAHGFEKVKSGFEKGVYKHPKTGETITPLRGGSEYGHSRKDGSTISAFNHKSSLEGHLAKHGYKKTTNESVEESEQIEDYSLEELQEFMVSEDFEQLDELSKTTLGNYIKKAANHKANTAFANGYYAYNHSDHKPYSEPMANKVHHDGQEKRNKGIKRAVNKLTRESTEQVEEGWDDMLKHVKDKNGPQPNGGSGKKQGTRYGGGKQKEDESEKRKSKNESLEETQESTMDEEVQKDIVKLGAKEIKHANVKDKLNDQDVMEPHSKGEADFLDQHSIEVTDDPARDGHKTGADKLSAATQPRGQGAGKYDGKNKTGVKESASQEDSAEEIIDEACGGSKVKGKKTYSSFKSQMNKG